MVRFCNRRGRFQSILRTALLSVSWILVLGAGVWGSVHADPGRVSGAVPTAPHEVSSKVCGECHQEIYQEWKGSMHAKSTALSDPIHGAFYRSEVGDPTKEGQTMKNGQFPVCLGCHAPNAALQKTTKLDAKEAFSEGVNCIFCHTITEFKGTQKPEGGLQLGAAAYSLSKTHLQAPSGMSYSTSAMPEKITATTPAFHPFPMEGRAASVHRTNDVCMGCHERRDNSHGVPLCATGTEIDDSKQFVTCQSCHMPTVNGHASHAMAGGHDPAMVRRAVTMVLDVQAEGDQLAASVRMVNRLPHKFPTGAPFRVAIVKVTAYDDAGTKLWQNYESHPSKDDPKSALMYVLGDAEGKPSMPPTATKVLSDSRLEPNTERTIEYKIPSANVKVVRAELLYNLVTPALAKRLEDVLTDDLKADRLAAFSEVRL